MKRLSIDIINDEASLDIQMPEYGLLTKYDREFHIVAVRLSSLVERE